MLYFALFFRSISTSLCLFTILKFLLFRPFWAAQTEQIGLLCVWWTLMSVCSVGHRSPAKWHDVLSEARVSDLRLMVCLWKTLSLSLSLSLFSFHSWCVYVKRVSPCPTTRFFLSLFFLALLVILQKKPESACSLNWSDTHTHTHTHWCTCDQGLILVSWLCVRSDGECVDGALYFFTCVSE